MGGVYDLQVIRTVTYDVGCFRSHNTTVGLEAVEFVSEAGSLLLLGGGLAGLAGYATFR